MPYATRTDLRDHYGLTELQQLLDRDGDGIEDAGVLDKVLADTDAEIDAYLAGRYTLPLAPVPTVLPRVAADIARYRLFANQATEEVRNRYNDAIRFLSSVAKGDVQLGANTPAAAQSPAGSPSHSAPDRAFTRDNLDDY